MASQNTDNVTTYIDEVDANTTYVGIAPRGTLTSKDSWQIKKLLTSGTITTVLFPSGDDKMAYIWDSRTLYTYQ